jgi:hypothetical protein
MKHSFVRETSRLENNYESLSDSVAKIIRRTLLSGITLVALMNLDTPAIIETTAAQNSVIPSSVYIGRSRVEHRLE